MKTLWITYAYLVELDACSSHRRTFQRFFPQGVEVTVEEAVRHSDDFDWTWAVRHILDPSLPSGQAAWLAADKAYSDYCDAADSAYMIFRNSGHQENYRLRTDEARKEYKDRTARIFAEAFLVQGGRELMEQEECS